MRTYLSVCRKEMLLLLRDKAGLAMLFIMPMVLILISSLMQESGWGELTKDPKVDLLFVDNDDDSLGYKIRNDCSIISAASLVFIASITIPPIAITHQKHCQPRPITR